MNSPTCTYKLYNESSILVSVFLFQIEDNQNQVKHKFMFGFKYIKCVQYG